MGHGKAIAAPLTLLYFNIVLTFVFQLFKSFLKFLWEGIFLNLYYCQMAESLGAVFFYFVLFLSLLLIVAQFSIDSVANLV